MNGGQVTYVRRFEFVVGFQNLPLKFSKILMGLRSRIRVKMKSGIRIQILDKMQDPDLNQNVPDPPQSLHYYIGDGVVS